MSARNTRGPSAHAEGAALLTMRAMPTGGLVLSDIGRLAFGVDHGAPEGSVSVATLTDAAGRIIVLEGGRWR